MFTLVKQYKLLLHERPFITNVLTTCTFMTVGDLTSQCILQRKKEVDLKQTARFATAGLLFVGPAVRSSLVLIDRLFGPTNSLLTLGKKVALDQLVCAPMFVAGNVTTLTLLKTQSIQEVEHELKSSYFSLLKLNYQFWPFVQMLNYYFIPLTYRVLFGSVAALAWNTLFSYRLNTQSKTTLSIQ